MLDPIEQLEARIAHLETRVFAHASFSNAMLGLLFGEWKPEILNEMFDALEVGSVGHAHNHVEAARERGEDVTDEDGAVFDDEFMILLHSLRMAALHRAASPHPSPIENDVQVQ